MDSSLQILSELTKNLPHLSDMIGYSTKNKMHFNVERGVINGETLYKNDNITIIKASLSEDAISLTHHHHEEETLHIFDGKAVITLNNQKIILEQYESITIPAGIPHKFECMMRTKVIAILMPGDPELSDG